MNSLLVFCCFEHLGHGWKNKSKLECKTNTNNIINLPWMLWGLCRNKYLSNISFSSCRWRLAWIACSKVSLSSSSFKSRKARTQYTFWNVRKVNSRCYRALLQGTVNARRKTKTIRGWRVGNNDLRRSCLSPVSTAPTSWRGPPYPTLLRLCSFHYLEPLMWGVRFSQTLQRLATRSSLLILKPWSSCISLCQRPGVNIYRILEGRWRGARSLQTFSYGIRNLVHRIARFTHLHNEDLHRCMRS